MKYQVVKRELVEKAPELERQTGATALLRRICEVIGWVCLSVALGGMIAFIIIGAM